MYLFENGLGDRATWPCRRYRANAEHNLLLIALIGRRAAPRLEREGRPSILRERLSLPPVKEVFSINMLISKQCDAGMILPGWKGT